MNTIGASCKRRDKLREKQAKNITESILNEEIQSGRGLNQEMCIKRACDTHKGSHYTSLLNVITMFSSIINVLEDIERDGICQDHRAEAKRLLESMESFDFIFCIHLMVTILGITNELNLDLQKNDQEIVNAMSLVEISKRILQETRENGWEFLMNDVLLFCKKCDIEIVNMEDAYIRRKRRLKSSKVSNLHYYKVDLFYGVIDMQLLELNICFDEVNTELLLCVACLNPNNSFSTYDKQKLLRMGEFYPNEFSTVELLAFKNQLENYIADVWSDERFAKLKGIEIFQN